jgi:predicted short-subunit dehydrogenase-like oxidoreductase (DUF2520 family)
MKNRSSLEVTIVGAGKVGAQLARRFQLRKVPVVQIYSKTREHAIVLAHEVGAKPIFTFSELQLNAKSLVILAVKDSVIKEVAAQLAPYAGESLVVHTSGTFQVQWLAQFLPRVGGFYPLMTFAEGSTVPWSQVPIGIGATQPNDQKLLRGLARQIGAKPFQLLDNQRLGLHVSAVFANNFTNHLLHIVFDLMQKNQLDTALLLPLIKHTVAQLEHSEPRLLQTGPAVRSDTPTIQAHLEFLKNEPAYLELYALMTRLIQNR